MLFARPQYPNVGGLGPYLVCLLSCGGRRHNDAGGPLLLSPAGKEKPMVNLLGAHQLTVVLLVILVVKFREQKPPGR